MDTTNASYNEYQDTDMFWKNRVNLKSFHSARFKENYGYFQESIEHLPVALKYIRKSHVLDNDLC